MAVIEDVNAKLLNSVNFGGIANSIGWIVFGVIVIVLFVGGFYVYWQKKQFGKFITAFEVVGTNFSPTHRDRAKVVKLGKGGFEVLYLKKLKTWKIAFGGRIGTNTYYFFVNPGDGYWYNGMLGAEIFTRDKLGGLIPVVTTNPTMRAQYTALEKQIDALHGDKKSFWDKYGNWVLTITFVLIIGILAWLIYREMSPLMGQFTALTEKMSQLTEQMTKLAANLNTAGNAGGLVR